MISSAFCEVLDPVEALKIIEMDATPLLVESDSVSEVLARLAAISSREKAMELIGRSPSLLVGGAMNEAQCLIRLWDALRDDSWCFSICFPYFLKLLRSIYI